MERCDGEAGYTDSEGQDLMVMQLGIYYSLIMYGEWNVHVGISIDWSVGARPYEQAKDTFVCLSHPNKSDDYPESASTNAQWLDSTSMKCNGHNGLREEKSISKPPMDGKKHVKKPRW